MLKLAELRWNDSLPSHGAEQQLNRSVPHPLMMMTMMYSLLCMFAVSLFPLAWLALVDLLACFWMFLFMLVCMCNQFSSSSDINLIACDCLSKLSNINMNVTSSKDSHIWCCASLFFFCSFCQFYLNKCNLYFSFCFYITKDTECLQTRTDPRLIHCAQSNIRIYMGN